jgi:hypothetical protein
MRARWLVLAAAAAAIPLTFAATAPTAAKQRVQLDLTFYSTKKSYPAKTFHLSPFQAGTLKADSGRVAWPDYGSGRKVMRNGLVITVFNTTWTLIGKRGTLAIRERSEWVDVDGDANDDGHYDGVAFGTWKVVRGTGQYAGLAGSGGSAHAGLGNDWNAHYEGFLAPRSRR